DIADQLESGDFSIKKIQPYLDQFSKTQDNLLTKMTDIGARSKSVEYTQSRLEDTEDNLIKKSDDVEYVNPADAYTDLKMADFGYTAALKIGENILRPTFLDFMK
ncbi:MAG: flagellar hook-associated protein 3, partial [Bacillota bacterium]|nr:flagellar hook-associated protein 3 [Bacillota bacterium]